MKSRHLSLLLLPAASFAATPTAPAPPEFPEAEIDLPPLSLADAAKRALPDVFRKDGPWARHHPALFASAPAAPGRLGPKRNVDPKMLVPPDPAIDYKMLIASPRSGINAK